MSEFTNQIIDWRFFFSVVMMFEFKRELVPRINTVLILGAGLKTLIFDFDSCGFMTEEPGWPSTLKLLVAPMTE